VYGTNSGYANLENGVTKEFEINGKKYTITNNGSSNNRLSYALDATTGKMSVNSNNYSISSSSGQNDNISISGHNNIVNSGDLNDTIEISSGMNNNISAGAGDDYIKTSTLSAGTGINGDGGNDYIVLNGSSEGQLVDGAGGNDTIRIISSGNTNISGWANKDVIFISGDSNSVQGADGDDNFSVISGSYNTLDGGSDNDRIYNGGTNTTYSKMNERVDNKSSYNLYTGSNITRQKITTELPLPEIELDISSAESAVASIQQLDSIMTGLSASRIDMNFQTQKLTEMIKTNTVRIQNLTSARGSIADADIATEYNNIIAASSQIEMLQLLQSQISQQRISYFNNIINSLALW
jgi:hypothetical protein